MPCRILLSINEEVWNSLVKFHLRQGKAFVVLDDRLPKENNRENGKKVVFYKKMIRADAVKWVRVK